MVVHPPHELDPASVDVLDAQLRECDPAGETVVDLSGVTFCDSTGLRVLVAHHRRHADAGGRLVVRGASPGVWRVFEVSGLDQLLGEPPASR